MTRQEAFSKVFRAIDKYGDDKEAGNDCSLSRSALFAAIRELEETVVKEAVR